MSTQGNPRDDSQTPEELLAETQSLLSDSGAAGPTTGDTQAVEPTNGRTPHTRTAGDSGSQAGGKGLSAGIWASLILGAAIVVLLLVFILQNNIPADFQYFDWQFELPLGIAMLFAAIGGIFIAGIIGSVRIFVLNRKLKKISKALKS